MMDLRDAVKRVDVTGTDADRDRLIEILRETTARVRGLTADGTAENSAGNPAEDPAD